MRRDERVVLMPILERGSHIHPRVGGCFAEVAATLATQTWNGHPNCIPPVLLRLVWGVNDGTSPNARTSLAPLIPWAIGHPRRPHDLAADTAVITLLTAPNSVEHSDGTDLDPLLRRLNRAPRPGHVLDRTIWRRAARHMVRAQLRSIIDTADGPDCDARLRALLVAAIDATRAVEGLPPMEQPPDVPVYGAHLLPVTAHLTSVDEVPELHVEPLLDDWPDWIRDSWERRQHELDAPADSGDRHQPQHLGGIRQLAPN
jgi:hypothetical protein